MKINTKFSITDVESFFDSESEKDYINFHKYRYQFILNCINQIKNDIKFNPIHFLDIGPMHQTNLIRFAFSSFIVDTLGYNNPYNKLREGERHIALDLNHTEKWEKNSEYQYNIVLFAEVLEHLYTRPFTVLQFLQDILAPNGYIIIQTPNGVSLDKRIKMLAGKNPFHLIEDHRQNHFREYTLAELESFGLESGFEIVYSGIQNYFNPDKTLLQKLYRQANSIIPSSLRDGLTVILKKKA